MKLPANFFFNWLESWVIAS